ncbi:MAG: AraC family transcriptional regulator [Pseudohongiellaceae bacterium]
MSQIQKSDFNTANLPIDQRFGAWRESIASLFDVTPHTGAQGDHHNTRVSSYLINNQIIVSGCETHAQSFTRNPLKIANDGLDYYMIQTHLTGSQVVQRGSRSINCRPGDLLVIDLAESHEAVTTDFTQRTLVVPRHLLAPHLLQPDSQAARVLSGDLPLTQLAASHLKTLFGILGSFSEDEALQVIEPTLLLMASALNGSTAQFSENGPGVSVSLLAYAKVEIEKSLHRQLSVERLCLSLKISRSALYRLFEPLGGVRAYVQERRLRRSAEVLLSERGTKLRICDIAYAWGFASEAHYSRAFRQRFGISPSDARLTSWSLRLSRENVPSALVGDRDYEQWLAENLRL